MDAVKIYGVAFSSYVRAARLMCQYKGIGHEVTLAPYGQKIPLFSDGHAQLHPFRKMPVLIDGDVVLPETCAIARYLDTKTGPLLLPADPIKKAKVDAAANMIAIYVDKAVIRDCVLEFAMPKGANGQVRLDVAEAALPKAIAAMAWVDGQLQSPNYFMAEQFTLCDALLIPMLDYLTQLPEPFNVVAQFPALRDYLHFHQSQHYCEGILGAADLSVLA